VPSRTGVRLLEIADQLRLTPGDGGPSSTVLLLRKAGEWLEIAALRDNTALVGFRDGRTKRLTDSRIQKIAPDQRARSARLIPRRLRSGGGYDTIHRICYARPSARNVAPATLRMATGSLKPTPPPEHTRSSAAIAA